MTNGELRITKVRAAETLSRRVSSFHIRNSAFRLATAVILLNSAVSLADETPRTGVIDRAGVVDAETEARINAWLLELETKTKAQLKVLTVETTEGRDIYEFGKETFNRWRLGQADKDNGALVVIAVKDRKWRILPGEGIEDTLPDAFCDQVATDFFLPNFRRGDFGKGILDGTAVLAQKIAADANVQLTGVPNLSLRRRPSGGEKIFGACSVSSIVLLFIFIAIMRNTIARQRYRRGGWDMGDLITSAMIGRMLFGGRHSGRGRWSGGSSFGGFGGGGSFGGGGFGGGGGGSFGGGGAGGSW